MKFIGWFLTAEKHCWENKSIYDRRISPSEVEFCWSWYTASMDTQKKKARTIAFDFDGVIAQYDGFKGQDDVQEPIAEVVKAIKLLKEKGHRILIHSTRGDDFLKGYCERFNIPYDFINDNPNLRGANPGKPVAYVYVDDRAICYRGSKAEELVQDVENFKAYWEG